MNINKVKDIIPITIIEEETTLKIILKYIEHHREHYLKLNLFGKNFHPCARCFGYWSGLFFGFFFLSPFWLGIVHAGNFSLVFATAWLFAIPTIADWGSVKLGLRKGNNKIRAIVGFFHGIAVIIYFLVLPASIFFKIATYALYGSVFFFIRKKYHSSHNRLCLTKNAKEV
jgi:uncharacterized membrane protein